MPPARLPALLAIGTSIAPNAKLAGELKAALEHPEDYVDAHAKELDERGIHEPVDHLPWVALVRGLALAQAVATLDGHRDAETVRRSIEALDSCPRGAFTWMKHDAELADRSTAELLELTGKALLAKEAGRGNPGSGENQIPASHNDLTGILLRCLATRHNHRRRSGSPKRHWDGGCRRDAFGHLH